MARDYKQFTIGYIQFHCGSVELYILLLWRQTIYHEVSFKTFAFDSTKKIFNLILKYVKKFQTNYYVVLAKGYYHEEI